MGTLGRNIDKICQKNAKIVNDFGVFCSEISIYLTFYLLIKKVSSNTDYIENNKIIKFVHISSNSRF